VAYNSSCHIEIEGLLKVTGSHVRCKKYLGNGQSSCHIEIEGLLKVTGSHVRCKKYLGNGARHCLCYYRHLHVI